jgi:drug/metabolite transporter (DMT)-like permease
MSRTTERIQLDAAIAGPLCMLAAALLFTAHNLLIKQLGPHYSVWSIGFYRFSGGVLLLVAYCSRFGNPYRGHNIRLLIIRGCTGALAFMFLLASIRMLPLSTAMVIFYSFPAFAAVFAHWLYREAIGGVGMACIVAVLVGIAILFDFQLTGNVWGQLAGLAGGAFAGLTVTLIRELRAHNGPVVIYLYFCTMGAFVTLPVFCLHPVLPANAIEASMLTGIVLTSITAQLLMNQGFYYCSGWEGGLLMSSEVIFTAAIGILFLGDPVTWRFVSGGGMIFISVLALNGFKSKAS